MNSSCKVTSCFAMVLALSGCASGPGERSGGAVSELASLLVGEYNNHAQVWHARQSDRSPPPRYDLVIQRMAGAPGRSESTLLLRQYREDGALFREARLVLESRDDGVVQHVQARIGDSWQTLEGCRVHWARQGDGFAGETRGDGCRFSHRESGEDVVFDRRWRVLPDAIELEETRIRPDGRESGSYRFLRLSYYTGWAGVLPGGPGAADGAQWELDRQISLHDGGDTVRIRESGESSGYGVRLERLTWPRSGIPMLRLSVVEADSGTVIAYGWSEPGSGRIGLNLGWIQVGLEARGTGRSARTP